MVVVSYAFEVVRVNATRSLALMVDFFEWFEGPDVSGKDPSVDLEMLVPPVGACVAPGTGTLVSPTYCPIVRNTWVDSNSIKGMRRIFGNLQ